MKLFLKYSKIIQKEKSEKTVLTKKNYCGKIVLQSRRSRFSPSLTAKG